MNSQNSIASRGQKNRPAISRGRRAYPADKLDALRLSAPSSRHRGFNLASGTEIGRSLPVNDRRWRWSVFRRTLRRIRASRLIAMFQSVIIEILSKSSEVNLANQTALNSPSQRPPGGSRPCSTVAPWRRRLFKLAPIFRCPLRRYPQVAPTCWQFPAHRHSAGTLLMSAYWPGCRRGKNRRQIASAFFRHTRITRGSGSDLTPGRHERNRR